MIFEFIIDGGLWVLAGVLGVFNSVTSIGVIFDSINLPAGGLQLVVPLPSFMLSTSIGTILFVSLVSGAVMIFARVFVWIYEHLPFIQ